MLQLLALATVLVFATGCASRAGISTGHHHVGVGASVN